MAEKQPIGQATRILLVEDNPAHAELVCRSLAEHRMVNIIDHVGDGEAALDFLHQRGKYAEAVRPHLVLLDLRLPRIDGLQVLKEVKATPALEKIPIVMLTTSGAEQDVARAYEYRANSYLVKPVDFDKFSEMMDSLGFYWLAWNHYPWDE